MPSRCFNNISFDNESSPSLKPQPQSRDSTCMDNAICRWRLFSNISFFIITILYCTKLRLGAFTLYCPTNSPEPHQGSLGTPSSSSLLGNAFNGTRMEMERIFFFCESGSVHSFLSSFLIDFNLLLDLIRFSVPLRFTPLFTFPYPFFSSLSPERCTGR